MHEHFSIKDYILQFIMEYTDGRHINITSDHVTDVLFNEDHVTDVLFNEDSKHNLISEFYSSESSDSEGPKSPEIVMISGISEDATPEIPPTYRPTLPAFTANIGLNADIQNTDEVSYVKLFITEDFF
jgi:hypothetical protein